MKTYYEHDPAVIRALAVLPKPKRVRVAVTLEELCSQVDDLDSTSGLEVLLKIARLMERRQDNDQSQEPALQTPAA